MIKIPARLLLLLLTLTVRAATVDVTAFGASPGDTADDAPMIAAAIAGSSAGDTLYFPPGEFKINASVTLSGDRTYFGRSGSALRYAGTGEYPWIFHLAGGAAHIKIDGLTFAGGMGVAAVADWSNPFDKDYFTDITIRNCAFIDNPYETWFVNNYIYFYSRGDRITITDNTFVNKRTLRDNVNAALSLHNCSHTLISRNRMQNLGGGACYFSAGMTADSVEWSGNVVEGYNWGAFTFFGEGLLNHARVTDNIVSGQDAVYKPGEAIGLSMVSHTRGLLISGNLLKGESGTSTGIELVNAQNAVVEKNVIEGFGWAFLIQSDSVTIRNNTFRDMNDRVFHVGGDLTDRSSRALQIYDNFILNPRFRVFGNQDTVHGFSFKRNLVVREGGRFSDDNTTAFQSLYTDITTGLEVSGNFFFQTAANPPAGFTFMGIKDIPGITVRDNAVVSLSRTPEGVGLFGCGVYGCNNEMELQGGIYENNTLQGLAEAAHFTVPGGSFTAKGNKSIRSGGSAPAGLIASSLTTAIPQISLFGGLENTEAVLSASGQDTDGTVTGYTFFFGDSAPAGTASGTARHRYDEPSLLPFAIGAVVKDNAGAMNIAVTLRLDSLGQAAVQRAASTPGFTALRLFVLRHEAHLVLPEAASVRLALYDINGRVLRILLDGRAPMGETAYPLCDKGLSAGCYLLKAATSKGGRSVKVLTVR